MKKCALLILLWIPSAVLAQQPSELGLVQMTLQMTRNDRNHVLDSLTEALARNQILTADLAKALARIKELELRPEAKEDPAK